MAMLCILTPSSPSYSQILFPKLQTIYTCVIQLHSLCKVLEFLMLCNSQTYIVFTIRQHYSLTIT